MFIDSRVYKVLRSSAAKYMVRPTHLPVRSAPLERQMVVSHEVYTHLASMEPDHFYVAKTSSSWRLTKRLPRSQGRKHIASAPHQHCSLETTHQGNEHGRH